MKSFEEILAFCHERPEKFSMVSGWIKAHSSLLEAIVLMKQSEKDLENPIARNPLSESYLNLATAKAIVQLESFKRYEEELFYIPPPQIHHEVAKDSWNAMTPEAKVAWYKGDLVYKYKTEIRDAYKEMKYQEEQNHPVEAKMMKIRLSHLLESVKRDCPTLDVSEYSLE
jgi:hypothetical protein